MGYRFEHPDFHVAVDGGFVARRAWLIHAAISHRKGLGVEARQRLASEANLEVIRGIARETRVGWSRGAEKVRVMFDTDGVIDRFFELVRSTSAPASAA